MSALERKGSIWLLNLPRFTSSTKRTFDPGCTLNFSLLNGTVSQMTTFDEIFAKVHLFIRELRLINITTQSWSGNRNKGLYVFS